MMGEAILAVELTEWLQNNGGNDLFLVKGAQSWFLTFLLSDLILRKSFHPGRQ